MMWREYCPTPQYTDYSSFVSFPPPPPNPEYHVFGITVWAGSDHHVWVAYLLEDLVPSNCCCRQLWYNLHDGSKIVLCCSNRYNITNQMYMLHTPSTDDLGRKTTKEQASWSKHPNQHSHSCVWHNFSWPPQKGRSVIPLLLLFFYWPLHSLSRLCLHYCNHTRKWIKQVVMQEGGSFHWVSEVC